MARIASLAILTGTQGGKDYLAESYGKVIENVQKNTISAQLKNTDLSGDPTTGTVEAKRFTNSSSQAYGTARSGGAGTKVTANPVTISINVNRELINEVEEKDTRLYGVEGLVTRKSAMDQKSMERELERAFFTEAATAGTAATLTATAINKKVEELIQTIENTQNDYVDGVPRDLISVVLDTATYGELRDFLDTVQNANVDTGAGEFGIFHGVKVYPSVYLPAKTKMIGMVNGSIAQPVVTSLDEAGKFPASDAYHFGMFFYYGTKAVTPDLIHVVTATGA